MGRPLYSLTLSTPAVRTEPEPAVIPYEKWSILNPFDPDADEFFNNEHAVYEDFTDLNTTGQQDAAPPPPAGAPMEEVQGSAPQSSVLTQEPASYTQPFSDWNDGNNAYSNSTTLQYAAMFEAMASRVIPIEDVTTRFTRPRSASVNVLPDPRAHTSRLRRSPVASAVRHEGLPRTSHITPINVPVSRQRLGSARTSRGTPVRRGATEWVADSPSYVPQGPVTPTQSSFQPMTPSSPSSVTPRFLSWSSRDIVVPPSPTPSGPLTNPSARMSFAHITPNLMRDVVM